MWGGNIWRWRWTGRGTLFVWEEDIERLLSDTMIGAVSKRDVIDEWIWKLDNSEGYIECGNHLFLHRSFSVQVWYWLYGWLGFPAVLPNSNEDHYLLHRGLFRGENKRSTRICFGIQQFGPYGFRGMHQFSRIPNRTS